MKKISIISRILSVVCCIMMATTVCNAQSLTKGSGTESDPYQISSQTDLETFAKDVNSGISYVDKFIELTNNIKCDYDEDNQWTPIGNDFNSFQGTFDGNEKTISGLYFDNSNQNFVGLFGNNQGTIKNVGVVDSYFNGEKFVGGVCGYNNGAITNCYNTGKVSGSEYVGGVCGYNDKAGTITNCYNTGEVSGSKYIGGVSGYNNNGTITNCYNTGEVSGSQLIGGVSGYNYQGTITNCYYLSDTDKENDAKTKEQFNNGFVAYKLSQGDNGGVWGQDLSKDNLPMLNGSKVYKNTCENVLFGYSNEDKSYEKHEYENGICIRCGSYQPADINTDGVYEIANAGNLYWFAQNVNKGDEKFNANAILTDNIVVNTEVLVDGELNTEKTFREWTPISRNDANSYKGTFNGNGKTISGLYFNNSDQNYVGLFGYNKGTIQNVGVVDSYFNGNLFVGGVCGDNYNGNITNCYNTGKVSGTEYIGGVCGKNVGTITYCYNTGKFSGNKLVGGVCGVNYKAIENCYYLSKSENGDDAKTQAQFYSGEVAYLLSQGDNGGVWGQDLRNKNSLPILYGPKVKKIEDNKYENEYEYNDDGFAIINGITYSYQQPEYVNSYYQISKPGHLYWFAQYVNQGGENSKANAILMNNIVVNTEVLVGGELKPNETFREWTPIGNGNSFQGTFNGNGKTISGLYFNNSNQSYVGLFGYNKGTIQNVGVVDSYFNGNKHIGGVSGYNEGPIKNCYNTGEVSGSQYIGGVCGYNKNQGPIENCYNTGVVSGSQYIGGVCGYNYKGNFTNCYNTGVVSGTKNFGGVCGYNYEGNFTNCYNNSDFYPEGDLTTFDFCNGNLFEGFSKETWSAGSAKVENGKVLFTLPYFKEGYKPIINGEFVVKVNSEKKYYFDTEFAKDDISKISIKVGNKTYEDKSKLELIDADLKDGIISGKFYELEFSASVNLTDYTYKTPIFTWNTETVPPTAKVSAECNENSKHNIDNADCEITKVEGSEIAPTCEIAGTVDYKATYKTLSDTKTIEISPALGHKYGEPTFSWTEFSKAIATFTCEKGDDKQTIEGKITSEKTIEPTATQNGKMVYTATFEFNGDKFTDKKEQDLDPTPTNEISQTSQYKVWGNNGVVYIETENTDSQVQIFDINGRLIKSESLTNSHSEIIINKKGVFVVVIDKTSYKVAL